MAIEAQLFDGTVLEFPDGTDPSVIQSTAKRMTAERQQPEPSYDPMSGTQITGIAPKIEIPKPTLLTGTTAPTERPRTGEYLPSADNSLQRVYDSATPLQREELAAKDPRFQPIHEFYLAQDLINKVDRPDQFYKPMVPLDTFDTRVEARKNFLVGQGLAPDFAEATARRQALAGAGKMTPYGEVREAPPEYDIEKEYRMRPEMSGIEETAQFLKRSGVKGGAAILKGAGGINMFVGDVLGLDTSNTKNTLDELNRYTQAIGVAPSKPVAIFEGAVESIAQQMPSLIGGVITGSEIPVLASMFAQSFGQTYDESKRMGMDTTDAAMRSSLYAGFEVLGEKLGLGDKLKGLKAIAQDIPTKDLSTYFAKALVKEIPGEQLTYAGQFATDKGYGVNPEAGFKEFLQGSADTLAATVVQGSLMLGGGAGAQKVVKAMGAARPPEEVITPKLEQKLEKTREELGGAREEPVAPEATTVAPEAAPVPPEILQQDTGALDMKKMLAELDEKPQEVIQKGIENPASLEGQVLENIERKQIATPQFKEWFGESKVKDDQGKPLVVYHGTTQDITSFDPSKSFGDLGASFFTEDPKFASSYDYTQGKGNVLPVYLSANNIFDFGKKEQRDALKEAASKIEIRDPVRGFVTLDTKIPDSEQYFDTEHPEVFKLIKDLGYDGVKLKERGVTNYAVFNPTQIKSAIGNTGAFSKASPNITENFERLASRAPEFEQEQERKPSLRVEMNRLKRLYQDDKITPELFANQSVQLLQQTKTERQFKDRQRGENIILEKMNAAVRRGELDPYAVDFATWFIKRNPALVDDLAISIKTPKEGSPSGAYTDLARLMTLYKESGNAETAVHEILHHTERMLPEKVQEGIRELWLKRLLKAAKKAEKGDNKNLADYFSNLINYHLEGDVKSLNKAKDALRNGEVEYSNYQYVNPSEFWAVNATDIASGRFEGSKSFLGKLKQWLREFAQKAKALFGLTSDAPIIRALDSLSKADGKFQSKQLIGGGEEVQSLKRTFKDKKTGQQVSPELTPKLYSWAMPEQEDLILGYKKDDLMYQFLDKQIDTKQMQEAILKAKRKIDDEFNAYQKETLYHGKVAAKTGDFLKGDVLTLVRDMNKAGVTLEQLEEYLHMSHAEERNDKMNERNIGNANLQNRGSGVSTTEAKEYFDKLSAEEKAKLEPLAKQVYDIISETQDILVRSGAEEKGLIDTWRKTYKKYVPLFREDDDFVSPPGTQMGSGFRVQGATSKRATGSTKKVSNIIGNIIAQRERAIVREEKMKVGRVLYGMAILHPNPDFWFAFNPDAVKSKKAAIEELKNFGVKDAEGVMSLMEAPRTPYVDDTTGQVGYRLSPITLQQHNAFPVRINGKDRYIFFNQKNPQAIRMAKTLSEIDTDKLDAISKNVGKLTNWLAAVNTQYNPVFGAVNLIRDVKGAMYNLTTTELAGKQKEVAAQVMPSMNTIRKVLYAERNGKPLPDDKDSQLFIQFRDDGGQTGYRDVLMRQKEEEQLVAQELRKIQDPALLRQARHFVRALSDFNDTMENSVRFAAYKTALENDISRDKAAYIAKELTVNFDRKGNLNRRINAYFAFFNAAIRGSARIYKTLKGPAGQKIMAGGVALGVLQAAMLAGYPDDDPPEFVRERNFIIPVPGTKQMFTIPYPLGYHVFPGLGRIVTEFMFGNRKIGKAVTDSLSMFADAFNPLGGGSLGWQTVAPTVLKLPAQVAQNKDAFGRPIYREDRATQPTPGYLRSRDTASTVSKFVSEALNYLSFGTKYKKGAISPTADEIDFYAGQVTGGVGRELAKTKDLITNLITGEETPSYRIPLLGRFYSDVDTNASKTQRFYNNVVEMSNHEQEIKGRQKNRENVSEYYKEHPEAKLWQQANNIENQLTAIKKERKELKERGVSEDIIKRKNDQMIRLMDNFNNQVEKAKK